MLKLGIIGTGAITHSFIDAAHTSQGYKLAAVYSRSLDKAKDFATSYDDVKLYADMEQFLQADLDVVYIASPNSLHFPQAKQVLEAGKHAIVEKPMVSTPTEFQILADLAKEKELFLFEAARNYQEESFPVIREFLKSKKILGAFFSYAKYSSKMGDLLAGKNPNVFSADFSGGALMDLGIYPIYAAVGLLGHPKSAQYTAQQLPNTVDLNGVGQLFYDDFFVTIQAGKNISSFLKNEIYTTEGTLVLDYCQHIHQATFIGNDGQETELVLPSSPHPMLEEAQAFATAIETQNHTLADEWLHDAKVVHQTLYTMRQSAGIHFKVDTNETTTTN